MNTTSRFASLSRLALVAGFVAAAANAHAGGGVYWAVNVNAPVQGMGYVSTAVSNTRHGVYSPAPVVYAPAPVVYAPPAVVVQPRPVYVPGPAVVYQEPRRCNPRGAWAWGWRRHHHHHDEDRYAWNDGPRGDQRMMAPRDGYGRDDGERGWSKGR